MALAAGVALPPSHLEIATRVAGEGRPQCASKRLDGTSGPCLPTFSIKSGKRVNAAATGGHIEFTLAATVVLTRDEFALLAGHEVAHYFLGHSGSTPIEELAADRLGAELACKAGFDPIAGASLFRYLKAGTTHPRSERRRAVVEAIACHTAQNPYPPEPR